MADLAAELAHSDDPDERVRAAQLLARRDVAAEDALVLRLLRDADSAAVGEAMAAALLQARRERAIRLILRSLGQSGGAAPDERDERLLDGLITSELDGVEVRPGIVSVLLETRVREERLGALAAISWLAPAGGFPAPPRALEHVSELAEDADEAIRVAAGKALLALEPS